MTLRLVCCDPSMYRHDPSLFGRQITRDKDLGWFDYWFEWVSIAVGIAPAMLFWITLVSKLAWVAWSVLASVLLSIWAWVVHLDPHGWQVLIGSPVLALGAALMLAKLSCRLVGAIEIVIGVVASLQGIQAVIESSSILSIAQFGIGVLLVVTGLNKAGITKCIACKQ